MNDNRKENEPGMDHDEKRLREFAEEIFKDAGAALTGAKPEEITKDEAKEALIKAGRELPEGDPYKAMTSAALEVLDIPYSDNLTDAAAGMMREVMGALFSNVDPEALAQGIRETEGATMARLVPAAEALKKRLTPEALEKMKETAQVFNEFAAPIDWTEIRQALKDFKDRNPIYQLFGEITGELAPYIEDELKKPEYNGRSIGELFEEAAESGEAFNLTLFAQAVDAAREAKAEAEKRGLDVIKYKRTPNLTLNVGKGALRLFDPREWTAGQALVDKKQIPGQLSLIPVSYEKKGADEITLFCGMTSDSFLRCLTPEDFFILSFLDDAYISGNAKCSVHWLFKEYLGERPSDRQLNDFYKKLEGLAGTTLKINDAQVRAAWEVDEKKTKRTKYREIIQAAAPIKLGAEKYVASGQVADATVLIYDRPAVLQADRVAKQITTVPKSLLQVRKDSGRFVSRTARFYRVLFYLIRRIALIKSGTSPNMMILNSFYNEIGDTAPNKKALAYNTMMDVIHHFEREGWITGHKTTKSKTTGEEALTFTWSTEDGRITGRATRKRRRLPKKSK